MARVAVQQRAKEPVHLTAEFAAAFDNKWPAALHEDLGNELIAPTTTYPDRTPVVRAGRKRREQHQSFPYIIMTG